MARGRLSRTHNEPPGMFDDDMVDKDEHGFYIKSLGILSRLKQRRMTGEDLKRTLQNKGVSKMELDDLGLTGMLSGRDRVDLDDVEAHIMENKPEFKLETLREGDFSKEPTPYFWEETILDESSEVGKSEISFYVEMMEENFDSGEFYLKELEEYLEDKVGSDHPTMEKLWLVKNGFLNPKEFRENIPSLLSEFFEEKATAQYLDDPLIEISMEGDEVGGKIVIKGKDDFGYTIEVDDRTINTDGSITENNQGRGEDPMYFDDLENARERAFDEAFDRGYIEIGHDDFDGYEEYSLGGGDNYQVHSFVIDPRNANERFGNTHFDSNAMYHVRTKDRPTPDGKGKLLYIEELQSDWGKQYRDNPDVNIFGMPIEGRRPPFVTDTKAWTDLAAKQLATYARENGYEGIAFAPGEVHENRYGRRGESGLKRQYDKNLMGSMNTIFDRKASVYEDPEGFASGSPMWIFDDTDKQKIDQGFSQYVAPIGTGILTGGGIVGGSLTPTQKAFSEAVNTPMPFERDSIFDLDPDALRAGREMMAGDTSGMISDAQRLYGLLSGYFTGEPIAETDKRADQTQQAVYGALSEGAADDPGIQNYLGPLQEGEEAYQRALEEVTQPRFMGTYPLDEELYKTNPRLFRILNTIDQYGNPFHVEPNFQR